MKAEFKPNEAFLKMLEKAETKALELAIDQLKSDLILSQTVPFDTGTLQNVLTFIRTKDKQGDIISQGPYARRLYFHPEYNFRRDKNPNAGGRWLDPYLKGGAKQNLFREYYRTFLKKELGT